MKKVASKISGLSFEVTETGMKTAKNVYVIHDSSGLPVASFIGVKNPTVLIRIANLELQHPTYWTQSADDLRSDLKTLGEAVAQLERRVHSDRYGRKTAH